MKVSARRTDLYFEDAFNGLAFEIVEQRMRVDLIRSIYERLLPLVPLAAADIRMPPTDNIRDAKIIATAANGQVRVELSAEQMLVAFTNLPQESSIELAGKFTGPVESAVREKLPLERVFSRSVRRYSHLAAAEEGFDAELFLRGLVSPGAQTAASKNGADAVSFGFQTILANSESGWSARLFLERSLLPETALFLHSQVLFGEGKIPPVEEALAVAAAKTRQVLLNFGLELV